MGGNVRRRIERRLTFWKMRTLTLKGKVLVLNVLMISKLWYILYTSSMPLWAEKRLKNCFLDFLWEGKPARIAYNTLMGAIEKGRLGLMDVEQRKNSLRVKMVKKYMDEENKAAWKVTMGFFLSKCSNFNLGDNILWMRTKNWMTEGLPDFYRELLRSWGKFLAHVHFNPQGRENILNQPLFLNNGILNQGKEIFFKKWLDVGIMKVRDVLYEFKEGFLPTQLIVDIMEEAKEDFDRREIETKYDVIKNSIPPEWLKRIENMEEGQKERDLNVILGENLSAFKTCTVKMLYCLFRDAVFKRPVANLYWLRTFNDLKEDSIWTNMKGKLMQTKLQNSEYFIRHKAIFTDAILNKIGMEQSA